MIFNIETPLKNEKTKKSLLKRVAGAIAVLLIAVAICVWLSWDHINEHIRCMLIISGGRCSICGKYIETTSSLDLMR